MLEQLQVAEMAMLPSKEAKEILYILLAESFVSLQVREGRNKIKVLATASLQYKSLVIYLHNAHSYIASQLKAHNDCIQLQMYTYSLLLS